MADLFSQGNYREIVAQACGVSKATFYSWIKNAEEIRERYRNKRPRSDEEKLFLDFLDAIEKAEAEAEADALKIIKAHSYDDWKAAAWLIERKNWKRWGRKDDVRVSGNSDDPTPLHHKIDVSELPYEILQEAERVARIIHEHRSGRIQEGNGEEAPD